MKKAILILLPLLVLANGFAKSDSSNNEQLESKIVSLSKEIKSLESSLVKKVDLLDSTKQNLLEVERDLKSQESAIEVTEDKIKEQKTNIGKYDLASIERSIKYSEKEKKSLESQNASNHKKMAKYRGQIEALRSKIVTLEGEIKSNDKGISEIVSNLADKQKEIEKNGLVSKDKTLKDLNKINKEFQTKHRKLESEIVKTERTIHDIKRKISADQNALDIKRAHLESLMAELKKR